MPTRSGLFSDVDVWHLGYPAIFPTNQEGYLDMPGSSGVYLATPAIVCRAVRGNGFLFACPWYGIANHHGKHWHALYGNAINTRQRLFGSQTHGSSCRGTVNGVVALNYKNTMAAVYCK